MRFLKCQLVRVTNTYGQCSLRIPAFVQHVFQWLTCPAARRSSSCVAQAINWPVTRHRHQRPQRPTRATGSLAGVEAEGNLQHSYHCNPADVDHTRSVTNNSPCLVQPAALLDQCPDSPHSIHSVSVYRRHLLPLTSIVASVTPDVLNKCTNSSVSFMQFLRFYRGQTRSTALQHNSRRNTDMEESSENVSDDTDLISDSDTDMSYKLSGVGHDDSHSIDDVELDAWQERQEVTDNQETRSELVQRKSAAEMSLAELSRTSLNIVPYVARSVTLQNLVRLGVNLSKIQKVAGVAEYLIKADFQRHIVPQLQFLALVGVEANMVGRIYTANPLLFLESVEDLELRVGYLVHKNFGLREVAALVTKDPIVLLMDPVILDEKLAFLQNLFDLTAHQVREVVKTFPRLLPVKNKLLTDMKFHMHEFMGFSSTEIQQLLLLSPEVFLNDKDKLVKRFDYLHNHMLISHQQLLTWPHILATRLFVFKDRHLFLLHKDRAQYDPCKENYVSLKSLSTISEEEFCRTVAKSDLQEFYNFCKTL